MNKNMKGNKNKIKGESEAPFNVVLEELCVCPECGAKIPQQGGTPCIKTKCPKCNSMMISQEVPF